MIKMIAENKNYKAIDIGPFNKTGNHKFLHPKLKHIVEGKLFIGELLNTSGSEVSFGEILPETSINFLHAHHEHEELYIILKGYGQFQVDDDVFKIKEGSIVRVSPEGLRTLRNDSSTPMLYMVIQSRKNSLAGYDVSDGFRVNGLIKF